ncbi:MULTISPECIES: flagellar motor switch protein FliN [Vibrio]|uniref:Flagellar motor switch protein FliN n=2 Tax=Vibrio TaxID=662 RepID=A0A090S753_9VIBR|nr:MULTISPECIES: flagellar motor switch protein FliN [Vibrio]USD60557.1 flagellar motor switch protein FliN [Vibrio sp. SCSIO 43140]GAL22628.1 flagellar motor switch protein FliN [Vibrio maritimus]GAL25112.1 flagellar motor switch protein FliN [Vibrio variabilis]
MSDSQDQTAFDSNDLQFDDFELEDFDADVPAAATTATATRNLDFFKNIPVTVTLEVASKEIALGDLMTAGEGSIIELDKLNGEPLDVKVNGSLMGHAEVVVVNDKYGLRLIDVVESALTSMGQ